MDLDSDIKTENEGNGRRNPEGSVHGWMIVLVIVIYFIAARIGQLVAIPPGNVTPFWPAAGIILYVMLIKGPRIWPGIWLGAVIGNGWAYASFTDVSSSLNYLLAMNMNGAGDVLCALFGFHMINRAQLSGQFIYHSRGVLYFIIYGAVIGSMISATLGVSGLCMAGVVPWSGFIYTWLTWAVGDAVGMLVLTPLLLVWTESPIKRLKKYLRSWEIPVFMVVIVIGTVIGFGINVNDATPNYMVAYVTFPVLIWAAYRYGAGISFTVVAVVSTTAIVHTALGKGLFVSPFLNHSLIQLQMFIGIATITTLFLNAIIFERYRAIQSLKESKEELVAVNRELEAFSYSLSHDLRAPVRSVISFSQILHNGTEDRLDTVEKDYLARIIRAGKHMAELIDDTISLALVSHQELVREKVDITAASKRLINELQQQYPDHKVELKIQEGLSAYGDRQLLNIVMDNLISNAWKFSQRESEPLIEIYKKNVSEKDVICVKDNGVGLDDSYKEKLFQVFQRYYANNEFPGTGIGLATVRRIISRHQGHVWGEGAKGEGACFCFTLWDGLDE